MYWQSSTQNNVTSLVLHTWTCRRLISVHATRPVQKEQGSSVVMIRAGRYLQHSARTLQHCLITGCSSALIKMYTVQLKCTTKMQWRNTLSTFHFISYILILRTRFLYTLYYSSSYYYYHRRRRRRHHHHHHSIYKGMNSKPENLLDTRGREWWWR